MRLTHIKIVGFKSFVDSTTLVLPDNMTCIVGPNGCGKSNTIDAVRWVMGESSAKQLRGDSSTDVIFAGSTSRKPVSQASVELLFDNSDNTLLGEYAQYAEIAVKRVVNRDGQSQYFLNNTKCRRRDVTALFLGTGLGPRSYAIIEQGMISNLITAKPEELRVFLEEAAGISKYKERRKETEQRMARTRENLARLYDIREELTRQLSRLEKQAADATIFTTLQAQKRQKQAELAYIRLTHVQRKKEKLDQTVRQEEVTLEALYAKRREAQAAIEQIRVMAVQAQQGFEDKQKAYYSVGTEITKLEEAQKHQQQRRQSLMIEQQQTQQTLDTLIVDETQDQERQQELQATIDEHEPELDIVEGRLDIARERVEQAQELLTLWHSQWQAYTIGSREPREQSQVIQVKIQQHEKVVAQLQTRLEQLQPELDELDNTAEIAQISRLEAHTLVLEAQVESGQQQLKQAQVALGEQQEILDQRRLDIAAHQATLHQAQGRHDSLLQIQEKALQANDSEQAAWCQSLALQESPLLVQQLNVHRDWQHSLEILLGPMLVGHLTDQQTLNQALQSQHQSPQITYLLTQQSLACSQPWPVNHQIELQSLLSVVDEHSKCHLPGWLQGVYLAQDVQQALPFIEHLTAFESIITQQGLWLGAGWARLGHHDAVGMLVLQQDVDDLNQQIESLLEIVEQDQQAQEQLTAAIKVLQQQVRQHQEALNTAQASAATHAQNLSALQAKVSQMGLRRQRLKQDITQSRAQFTLETRQMQQCRQDLDSALASMAIFEDERIRLEEQQFERQQAVSMAQESLNQDQDRAREISDAMKFAQSSMASITQQFDRTHRQKQQHQQQLERIAQDLKATEQAQVEVDALPELLQASLTAQDLMNKAKVVLDQQRLQHIEQEELMSDAQLSIDTLRTKLENKRLQVQAHLSDLQHIRGELEGFDTTEQELASALPEHAQERTWISAIASLETKVQALGAINLAAVDEFQSQSERKMYIDEQYTDLESALFTLEEAIEQIDQETRARFQVTFTQVNNGMSRLFPRLFGGGQAQLQLIGDDILSAGVAIMAQPPGKKNTSIHMLSGGEKALTAISLVFAIFQLNPAPFCMLDEVDAPLDDANVGRYADMVKHMSQTVQFIYISHNKIAMEKADHLMGVTMQEPGVSRLVSVDMNEASSMVAL